jgi:uncharacterized protein (TIGR02217 family)
VSGSINARVSQIVAEALVAANNDAVRASQIAVESLIGTLGAVRASQVVVEALIDTLGYVRASQAIQQILVGTLGYVRASQIVAESLIGTQGFVRVSQAVLEVLVANYEVLMPLLYPTLPGLAFPVVKTPIFSTDIGAAASGREVRFALYQNPIWEWTLTYNYLGDDFDGSGSSDLKTLLGFYISVNGSLLPFQFEDPDDNAVTAQVIGTTDGTTSLYYLSRTYGGADGGLTEPVGMVNTTQTFNVYLAGVLQEPSTYSLNTSTPLANYITFDTTPAADLAITVDMSYYFWVRFKDDQYDFTKNMDRLWEMKKVILHSLRG